ncbi:hypothetical protein TNCV_3553201 [Trichonephila clavipes]|nr:hypothetical protein TNCV_3553201 [Trichonephila clavipes]
MHIKVNVSVSTSIVGKDDRRDPSRHNESDGLTNSNPNCYNSTYWMIGDVIAYIRLQYVNNSWIAPVNLALQSISEIKIKVRLIRLPCWS